MEVREWGREKGYESLTEIKFTNIFSQYVVVFHHLNCSFTEQTFKKF